MSSVFLWPKEDHTFGNLLRVSLLRDPDVVFASHRMPHPLQPVCEVTVQTVPDSDPKKAVVAALDRSRQELESLEQSFRRAMGTS